MNLIHSHNIGMGRHSLQGNELVSCELSSPFGPIYDPQNMPKMLSFDIFHQKCTSCSTFPQYPDNTVSTVYQLANCVRGGRRSRHLLKCLQGLIQPGSRLTRAASPSLRIAVRHVSNREPDVLDAYASSNPTRYTLLPPAS